MAFFDITVNSPLAIYKRDEFKIFTDFKRNLHVINVKLFYSLLEQLGYLANYLEFQAHHKTKNIKNWLKTKKLYTFEVLDSISEYSLILDTEIAEFETICLMNKKDLVPKFEENDLKSFFELAIINEFLAKNKDEYNDFVSSELDFIENEFGGLKDENILNKRKMLYSKNFLKESVFEFIEKKANFSLNNELENIKSLSLSISIESTCCDFILQKKGVSTKKRNGKSVLTSPELLECATEPESLKLEVRKNGIGDVYSYFEWILYLSERLISKQLEYDKRFFLNQILNKKVSVSISNATESTSRNTALEEKVNILKCCDDFDSLNSANNSYFQLLLLDKCYKNIENSNIIIGNSSISFDNIAILNLSRENIRNLNSLNLKPNFDFSSSIVNNYALDDFGLPVNGLNFAKIEI